MEKEKIKCFGSSKVQKDGSVEIPKKVMNHFHIKPGEKINLIGSKNSDIKIEVIS